MQVFTGSTKQACSNETPSGMRTVPFSNNPVHHPNIFRKPSARGLETRRATDFLVGRTLRKRLVAAVIALAARDVVKHYHAIAHPELRGRLRPASRQLPKSRDRKCAAPSATRSKSSSGRFRRSRTYAPAPESLPSLLPGTGTSSRRTSLTPRYTAAFIVGGIALISFSMAQGRAIAITDLPLLQWMMRVPRPSFAWAGLSPCPAGEGSGLYSFQTRASHA